jgi:hypothetical protein
MGKLITKMKMNMSQILFLRINMTPCMKDERSL